jgi:hypothetical protein
LVRAGREACNRDHKNGGIFYDNREFLRYQTTGRVMPRGGFRPGAGRPPGARNKSKPTARARIDSSRLKRAKNLDALQLLMVSARELYARGDVEAAGRLAARATPFTASRFSPFGAHAPLSPEQGELDLRPPEPVGPTKPADEFEGLLPN